MKKLFVIMAALLLTLGAGAQDKEVKGLQFGVNYRAEFVNMIHSQQSANLSLGYRINKGNYVGVQSGYIFKGSTYIDADPGHYAYRGIPLRGEYTHYFMLGRARRHSIYAGVEAGGMFVNYYNGFGMIFDGDARIPASLAVNKVIPYAGIKTGLDFNIADFTHLQLGITLNYIGYGVSAGFTF